MKINWKEYTKKALSTSTHASREKRISCCLFGLLGEMFEYEEKAEDTKMDQIELKKEMGDVFWYLAVLSYDINHTPEVVICDSFHNIKIIKEIAGLQELMKKDYRDNGYTIAEKYKDRIYHHIDIIYSFLLHDITWNGWDLSEILQMNIDKLESRKERNVLTGEGDNR